MLIPGPDHPITVEPAAARVTVRANGQVIADTTAALALREASYPPAYYVPFADLEQSLIKRTDTTTHCPYKGDASYYSIVTPDGEIADAIWTYEQPYPSVEAIRSHVAFYPDRVEISTATD
jgi:uncharacterized protein (DUF427 family)